MKHPYFKVTQKAKELLYPFMKLNDMKASSYTYHSFFESQISSNNILVIGHDLRILYLGSLSLIIRGFI